ncbi:MAG: V-type ATP synthase subunit D [Deltaproteobacteria bacterium]|nr:V-type ATP synthase subunit D [Deltaproteobacteria bacterium]
MARIEIAPTKRNLKRIKEELSFAYEGFELLNQKRELLVLEIVRRTVELRKREKILQDSLGRLYGNYRNAAAGMGAEAVAFKSLSERRSYFLSAAGIRFLGLRFPLLSMKMKKLKILSSLWGTTAHYDEAKEAARDALPSLVEYAAAVKTVVLLARELKKIQRRVNALEKIFIPQHEETVRYIDSHLEEGDREELFIKKIIREGLS